MQKLLQDMSIGENIRQLRKKHKLTQIQLSAQMQVYGSNMTDTTLAKIEGGYRNVRVSDLVILKTIFKVSFDDFFEGLIKEKKALRKRTPKLF